MHLTVFLASDLQTHYSWMEICITKGKSIGNYFVTLVKFWSFNKEYIHLVNQHGSYQVTTHVGGRCTVSAAVIAGHVFY